MFWIFNFDILATVWATFPKIWQSFQSSGHSGDKDPNFCSNGRESTVNRMLDGSIYPG
jgi:hypothetical protein